MGMDACFPALTSGYFRGEIGDAGDAFPKAEPEGTQ